jgi:hypothetical protein
MGRLFLSAANATSLESEEFRRSGTPDQFSGRRVSTDGHCPFAQEIQMKVRIIEKMWLFKMLEAPRHVAICDILVGSLT